MNKTKIIVVSLVIIAAVGLRLLLANVPNVAPISAMAIFAGMFFDKKYLSFIIPAAVMLLSDFFIGFHNTMWAVYAAFTVSAGIGILASKKINFFTVIGASLGASLSFFIITNFAVWMTGSWYPSNLSGLIECYIAAIPFFGRTILGDLFFTGFFVGGFLYAQTKFTQLAKA